MIPGEMDESAAVPLFSMASRETFPAESTKTGCFTFPNHEFDALSEWLLTKGYLGQCLAPDYRIGYPAIRHCQLAPYRSSESRGPFFFYNRVRRELALCPFAMLNQKVTVLAPYLSQNIFDLLIDLPYDYFRGRHFHSEAIDRFYPELPRQEYISTSTGFVPEKRSRIWTFARRMGGMALNGLSERSCIRRRFLIPRLAKALVNRDFGTQVPVLFSRILVMLHLENAVFSDSAMIQTTEPAGSDFTATSRNSALKNPLRQ